MKLKSVTTEHRGCDNWPEVETKETVFAIHESRPPLPLPFSLGLIDRTREFWNSL